MNRKRILIFGIVLVALCLLIYLQIRAWKTFDWHMFWLQTEHVNWLYIFAGLAFHLSRLRSARRALADLPEAGKENDDRATAGAAIRWLRRTGACWAARVR